MPKKSMIDKY